jgi:hypothetical protein
MPNFNLGQVGGLLQNLGSAGKWLLGGTAGAAATAYGLGGSTPGGGQTQSEFNKYRSENRFRNPSGISATDTGRGLANLPSTYRGDELQQAAAARAFGGPSTGGGIGGGNMASYVPNIQSSPAAERAYQSERSSVAQQAAQNPDLQRYQDQAVLARQALQGYDPASGPLPGAAQQAQDMGMAIWAKKYGPGSKNDLASKVRPGQSGFGAIQNTLASSAATAGLQMPSQLLSTPQIPGTTSFPTAIPQSGFQVPGAPTAEQLSSYPQFDPNKVDIGLFSKFMQANPKK